MPTGFSGCTRRLASALLSPCPLDRARLASAVAAVREFAVKAALLRGGRARRPQVYEAAAAASVLSGREFGAMRTLEPGATSVRAFLLGARGRHFWQLWKACLQALLWLKRVRVGGATRPRG